MFIKYKKSDIIANYKTDWTSKNIIHPLFRKYIYIPSLRLISDTIYKKNYYYSMVACTINSKINGTPKGVYLLISKFH